MHPKVHQALTNMTLATFASRLPDVIKTHTKQIIDGVKAEDNWWEPSRSMHWHFYRRKGSHILEKTRWLRMRPTSEYILAKRVEKMQSYAIDDPKRYEYLGRVLHHIQDMSTPSHARPVYHDPILHDHYESFMVDALKMQTFKPDIPDTVIVQEDDFITLYRNAAESTLHFMDIYTVSATVNGQGKELPLSVFWEDSTIREDKKHPGFGHFGKLHKAFKVKYWGATYKDW